MIKIAFVGTGGIARQHARGLVKRGDIRFVGAYDVVVDRAQAFAGEYGGMPYTNLSQMLDETKPDAVWVCLPPFAHGEAELALTARSIPFLVEKPMSNAMDTARRILDQIEAKSLIAAVGYMNRYRRSVARIKELQAQDPAVLVHAGWIGGTPGVSWWRVKKLSGGQILEQTTHLFDVVRYVVGEPVSVFARATTGFVQDMPNYDVEDASTVAVEFANGAIGNIMSCCANRSGGAGVHVTYVAAQHVAVSTGWDLSTIIHKSRLEQEQIAGEPDIFEIEDDAFVRAVQANDPTLIKAPYADAIHSLAFCLAADLSYARGEPVQVASL